MMIAFNVLIFNAQINRIIHKRLIHQPMLLLSQRHHDDRIQCAGLTAQINRIIHKQLIRTYVVVKSKTRHDGLFHGSHIIHKKS